MGAENRNHLPRLHPRETLLPCRHAASPHPSVGDRPLLLGRAAGLAQGQEGAGGMVVTLSYGLGPLEAQLHQLGGGGGGWRGRRSLSQGKLMPSWRREERLLHPKLEMGCQYNSEGEGHLCGVDAKGSPWTNQANCHGLRHSTFPLRALLTLGPGLSREGVAAGGMYCTGMFLRKAHATRGVLGSFLGRPEPMRAASLSFLEVSVDLPLCLRPLSSHSWLCLQADISLHPQSRTQTGRVPTVCAFECW